MCARAPARAYIGRGGGSVYGGERACMRARLFVCAFKGFNEILCVLFQRRHNPRRRNVTTTSMAGLKKKIRSYTQKSHPKL